MGLTCCGYALKAFSWWEATAGKGNERVAMAADPHGWWPWASEEEHGAGHHAGGAEPGLVGLWSRVRIWDPGLLCTGPTHGTHPREASCPGAVAWACPCFLEQLVSW